MNAQDMVIAKTLGSMTAMEHEKAVKLSENMVRQAVEAHEQTIDDYVIVECKYLGEKYFVTCGQVNGALIPRRVKDSREQTYLPDVILPPIPS